MLLIRIAQMVHVHALGQWLDHAVRFTGTIQGCSASLQIHTGQPPFYTSDWKYSPCLEKKLEGAFKQLLRLFNQMNYCNDKRVKWAK